MADGLNRQYIDSLPTNLCLNSNFLHGYKMKFGRKPGTKTTPDNYMCHYSIGLALFLGSHPAFYLLQRT